MASKSTTESSVSGSLGLCNTQGSPTNSSLIPQFALTTWVNLSSIKKLISKKIKNITIRSTTSLTKDLKRRSRLSKITVCLGLTTKHSETRRTSSSSHQNKRKDSSKRRRIKNLKVFLHFTYLFIRFVLDEKKPTSTKDVTAEGGAKPKPAKKAAKKVAKKEESDDEIKPFPDFLKKIWRWSWKATSMWKT